MNPNRSVTLVHAKDHPVLAAPLSWRVVEVRLLCGRDTDEAIRVELVLAGEHGRRLLRFDGVADFAFAQGLNGLSVRVLDVTHLQWRGIDVRVESVCGSLGFWARGVATVGDSAAMESGRRTGRTSQPPPRKRPTHSDS